MTSLVLLTLFTMKKIFRSIHLYLSLAAGIFIMIACSTGCIMVFEEEINQFIYPDRFYVKREVHKIALDHLVKIARNKKYEATFIRLYTDPERSVEINLIPADHKSVQLVQRKNSITAFMNPYNGEVLDFYNKRASFFFKVEMLHRFLLSKKGGLGQYLIGYSTFFFFFIVITGFILWWPKTKLILKQRLKIKWDGSYKRLLHDLHVVIGFYTSIFLIIMVMTGLMMGFNWINKGIYSLTNSTVKRSESPHSNIADEQSSLTLDHLEQILERDFKDVTYYHIKVPKNKNDVFSVSIQHAGFRSNNVNTYYLDQYSGKIIRSELFSDKNLGEKIHSFIKPVHTGEIFGLSTKIINFMVCLLTLSFPVTGVWMWLNRLKKRKKKRTVRHS